MLRTVTLKLDEEQLLQQPVRHPSTAKDLLLALAARTTNPWPTDALPQAAAQEKYAKSGNCSSGMRVQAPVVFPQKF
jgi:hypothetical protein